MASKTLTLKKFAVDDTNHLVFTVKGAANLIPEGVTSKAAAKGLRVCSVPNDASSALYDLGEAVKVNGTIAMDDADASYFEWFKTNFVPTANGGGLVVEDTTETAPPATEETAPETTETAPETTETAPPAAPPAAPPTAPPAAPEVPDLETQLNGMKANEVKKYAKDLGVKPGTSKAKTIVAIMAHQNRHANALATAKEAAAFVKANADNRDEMVALLEAETAGKARKSVLANINKAIAAIDKAAAPPTPPPAPPAPPTDTGGTGGTGSKGSGLSDEVKAKAGEIVQGIGGPVGELVTLLGRKRAQTVLRRLVGATDDDGEVNIEVVLGGGDGERKAPICHVLGAKHEVTKRHRDARGTCTYQIECVENGGYKLIGLTGNRTDVKEGDVFKHGLELIQRLTGRETGIPTVARWFGLI